ncbi:NAD-dependent epimerase/dehydratase family protein [Mordavella massiliensis]|uniref:NAD-dependent epimerase/dehydratase family protein n=1 Tax=Mordavella massiliensis TaxID=1871024 RepID=UPI00210DA00F|nr:NAD(P)-dependent oxidoreductase [Mordavella massiliensis]
MKILVTGANGYLGTGVVKQLCDDGVEVIATDFKTDLIDDRATKIEGNIFALDNPFEKLGKPVVLLHMAWRNGFVHNASSHINDLPNHYSFISKMIDGGCKQIAVMGTMHEVGFFEGSVKEETPTHPESLYGIAKDALRNTTKLLCKNAGATFQWLRGYYIVGNSEYGCSIFSKITAAEKKGQELFPFTMGINQWDFINYEDFAKQVAATVEQDKVNGVINICHGRPEKLADRVERFIKENGYKIKLDYGKFPDRPYDSKAVWGDDTKILEILENQ